MGANIRGLTLIRPWAWAVAHAGKDIENRTWEPPSSLVGGFVAIHAGKKWDENAALGIELELGIRVPDQEDHPSGVIVAVARLAGVQREGLGNPWFCGPVGWQLRGVVQIDPVPCKGAQGLWVIPDPVLVVVRERFASARQAVTS
jgi:hypothetical protein